MTERCNLTHNGMAMGKSFGCDVIVHFAFPGVFINILLPVSSVVLLISEV